MILYKELSTVLIFFKCIYWSIYSMHLKLVSQGLDLTYMTW